MTKYYLVTEKEMEALESCIETANALFDGALGMEDDDDEARKADRAIKRSQKRGARSVTKRTNP